MLMFPLVFRRKSGFTFGYLYIIAQFYILNHLSLFSGRGKDGSMGPLHGKFSLIDLAGKEHGHIAKLNSYAAKDALIFLLQSIYISTSTICIFAFLALWPLP